jgi:quinol monooxygenase YgiN
MGDEMYENATTIQFQSGTVDEALLILRAYVVPVLREQPGLIGLGLIPDRDADKITVISLWTSLAHALAVEAAPAYRKEAENLDPLLMDDSVYPMKASPTSQSVYQPFAMN